MRTIGERRAAAPRRTGAIHLRPLTVDDAPALLELRVRNRDRFRPVEPTHGELHFTFAGQCREIAACAEDARADRRYAFGIFRTADDLLVGRITLSNVARGAWQNANLGYYVDQRWEGRGHATAAVRLVLAFAFRDAALHRVQAGVLPDNVASARVLQKAGFRREGHAPRYLEIDGAWRDHDLFAITVEEWGPRFR